MTESMQKYATQKLNLLADSLRNGNYNAEWFAHNKKYFWKAMYFLPFSEARHLYDAYQFIDRKEKFMNERMKRILLLMAIGFIFPQLAVAFKMFENN